MEWRRRKARKITGKTSGIVPTGKETCGEHVYLRFSPRILCVPYGSDSNSSPKLKIRPWPTFACARVTVFFPSRGKERRKSTHASRTRARLDSCARFEVERPQEIAIICPNSFFFRFFEKFFSTRARSLSRKPVSSPSKNWN